MKLKGWFLIASLVAAVACSQTPRISTNNSAFNNSSFGTVSLGMGTNASAANVYISPRLALPDSAVTFGTPVFVEFVNAATNTRYLSATFPVTNNTATAFSNLTLYAFNKGGASLGGTAIQNMINFNGGSTASNAQSLLPIHKTVAGIPNPTIDANAADFQAFAEGEATDLQAEALLANIITGADTVLQYGFVARNGNSRTIPPGGAGTITIAYKLPDANVNAAYKFVANFVLVNDTVVTRVTRGLGDTTANADARATAITADEVFLIGNDSDVANVAFVSTRVKNILTSSSPVCLVQTLACTLVTTVNLTGNANVPANTLYTLGITAEPAAGTELTDLEVDWGDLSVPTNLATNAASATHTFLANGSYTMAVTASDSDGDVVTVTRNVAVP
jgi:hypothetical protein